MAKIVGYITKNIIDLLNLNYKHNTPIYLGPSNIAHMKNNHPLDYEIYNSEIKNIITAPDYVALNKDGSIEYVKNFLKDGNYVKVAVKISLSGQFFARTLYILNSKRVEDYIRKGTLKKV